MAARRELTKKFARQHTKAGKSEKGEILHALVASTGWTRIMPVGRSAPRTPGRVPPTSSSVGRVHARTPTTSYDALVVLQEVWRLSGQPPGKYPAAVMNNTMERLVRFRELGKVAPQGHPDGARGAAGHVATDD